MKVIAGHLGCCPSSKLKISSALLSSEGTEPSNDELFQFTLDNSKLSLEQREFYEKNGFLVIPGLIPSDMIDKWRNRFLDFVEGRLDSGQMTKMKDVSLKGKKGVSGEMVVNKIQDFVWDDVLSEHCQHPNILNYVECFTGPNIMAMHTMLINKPPDPGTKTSRHPMHQDLHYFPFRPANKIVCAWTAVENITDKNGCLFVVPGSHKGKLEQHEYPEWEDGVNKMYHGVRGFDDEPKKLLHMEKGDTVFFHPVLLHGSGANTSKNFRKAISCHFASSDCDYIDVRGTTQENIAKEVEEIAKRRGVPMDFRDIWKYRSRCVMGQEVNL